MSDLFDELMIDEGCVLHVYCDKCGKAWRLCTCDISGNMTIGVGQNIEHDIDKDIALYMLHREIRVRASSLKCNLGNIWEKLNRVRQDVLINMAYQLGVRGLMSFKKMIRCLEVDDFDGAAMEILDSNAGRKFKARWERHSNRMSSGRIVK